MNDTRSARERAAAILGVSPDSKETAARRAFFQRLERVSFVPPPVWCAGLSALDPTAGGGSFDGAKALIGGQPFDDDLRAELQTFVNEFWQLPPDVRRTTWQTLVERGESQPALRKHIDQLSRGLEIDAREFDETDGMEATLAAIIRDSFPLNPIARANARNARLAELSNTSDWSAAARTFRANKPLLAALDPELLMLLEDFEPPLEKLKPLRMFQPKAADNHWWSSWQAYLIIGVTAGILSAVFNANSNSPSSHYGSPNYDPTTSSPVPMPENMRLYVDRKDGKVHVDEATRQSFQLYDLVSQFQLRQDDAAYQKLKAWLQSPEAAKLRQNGNGRAVNDAQERIDRYERMRDDLKRDRP